MIRRVAEAGAEFWARLADIHAMGFGRGWTADELFRLSGAAHHRLYVAEEGATISSFVLLTAVAGEGEILTIATAPEYRRQGHAGRLLAHVAEALMAEQVETLFLEVAVDNTAARALYERAGFNSAGIRKAYYSRPGGPPVDACILRLALA